MASISSGGHPWRVERVTLSAILVGIFELADIGKGGGDRGHAGLELGAGVGHVLEDTTSCWVVECPRGHSRR